MKEGEREVVREGKGERERAGNDRERKRETKEERGIQPKKSGDGAV